jgi:hypothetical protein
MTTTREDRNAALVMCAILLPALDLVAADRWLEGDGKDLTGLSRAEVTTLTTAVVALTNHRRASTQVLREAAERLCAAVEAFARYGGDPIAMRNRMFASSNELRTALAALETRP